MARKSRVVLLAAWACISVAGLLLTVNVLGIFVPLRNSEVDTYVDFAGSRTTGYEDALSALRLLESAQLGREQTIRRATRIIHDGIAHIRPEDVRTKGLEHYRMRVPVYENWVLYLLSFVKPDTYRDYEFCRFEKALKRGTGRCGQQALALVDYLSSLDIPTGFVALGGHAIATAQTEEGAWYLLDPDYGAVIPFDLKTAEENPEKVLEHYWSPAAATNRIDHLYDKEYNKIRYGGPEMRYPRACRVETAAYILKWLMPALLLVLGSTIALWKRAGREHAVTI